MAEVHFDTVCGAFKANVVVVTRVEWEFWTSSNDACGAGCERQNRFKLDFANTAISLEKVQPPHLYSVESYIDT